MKKFAIIKEYLIDTGHGWEGRAEIDTVEELEIKTQKAAIKYFRTHYGPIVNIWSDNFYIKNEKKINVYALEKVPENDENPEYIAYAIAD